jgi:hypothetical protein
MSKKNVRNRILELKNANFFEKSFVSIMLLNVFFGISFVTIIFFELFESFEKKDLDFLSDAILWL